MMYEGEAHNMSFDVAEKVFNLGLRGLKWEPTMEDCLFCDLDEITHEAYEAGKKAASLKA